MNQEYAGEKISQARAWQEWRDAFGAGVRSLFDTIQRDPLLWTMTGHVGMATAWKHDQVFAIYYSCAITL